MAKPSTNPVPSITESEASGDIAALYGDIRETLGVPVVNLIWRHLAIVPGGLAWAWDSLRPLYASGGIAAEAAALRAGLDIPVLSGLSAAALEAVGLMATDIARIELILASYERSNAMNMVALAALLARLDGTAPAGGATVVTPADDDSVEGEMPPLLALGEMPPHVRFLVETLNEVGGRAEILASMYRHLANWPPYLGIVSVLLTPFAATGKIEPVIRGVIADGRQRGSALAVSLADPDQALDAAVCEDVRRALMRFIEGPIGKMIAVVPLISRAMPRD